MSTIFEALEQAGCTTYQFPKNIDSRIENYCNAMSVAVYEVPEPQDLGICPYNLLYILKYQFVNTGMFEPSLPLSHGIILVRSGRFSDRPKEELEFSLWHEIGHLISGNPYDEKFSDNWAFDRLVELYGNEDIVHAIVRDWLFYQYEVNETTGKYKDVESGYEHRIKMIEKYLNH